MEQGRNIALKEPFLYSALKSAELKYFSLILLSVFLPLWLKGPQLVIGSAVNFVIIYTVHKYGFRKALPAILAPSISALFAGVLFATFNKYLLFMIPAIWLGNAIVGVSFSKTFIRTKSIAAPAIVSAGLKSAVLFSIASILSMTDIIPGAMVSAFGVNQLMTAVVGGILAGSLILFECKKK